MLELNVQRVPITVQPNCGDHKLRILLAEDSISDEFLVRRALKQHGLSHELYVAKDGEEAMHRLERAEGSQPVERPELILLDLNLPKIDGNRVLAYLRKTEAFAHTPVIVLSSSVAARDRDSALSLGANRYFCKPIDLHAFMDLGRVIEETLREVVS
jgi:two-component system, chemotaxis family, response regulator Rcp1